MERYGLSQQPNSPCVETAPGRGPYSPWPAAMASRPPSQEDSLRPPSQELPILRALPDPGPGSVQPQYPTPPFTPRAAGSYPQSQSSLASWFDRSDSPSHRPRTVHGYGQARITRRFFVGGTDFSADRAQGRERVVAKTTIGCPKHYDVLMDPDDAVEFSGDHVRYRYVDFLTNRALEDKDAKSFESCEAVAQWLDTSHPYTRLDAYPLYILAKDVIRRLLSHELHSDDKEKFRIALELSQLKASLKELRSTTSKQLEDYRKRCESNEMQQQQMSDRMSKAEAEHTRVSSEFGEHKFKAQQQESAHVVEARKLEGELEKLRRRSAAQVQKLQKDLDAAHSFDQDAAALTIQKLLKEETEFLSDGRDHHNDKLLLLRQITSTFTEEERPDVLTAMFGSLGEDMGLVAKALEAEQRAALLQVLLVGAKPSAVFGQLEKGSAELYVAGLLKGCDVGKVVAMLEEQIGKEALLALLGIVPGVDASTEYDPPPPEFLRSSPELEPEPEPQGHHWVVQAMPKIPKNLAFMHKPHKGVQSLLHSKSHTMVATIYEQKTLADRTDDMNNHRRQTMPDFLRSWSLAQFGLRSIANKNLAAVCITVRENEALGSEHADFDRRLHTFGYLSGITPDPYEYTELPCNFCIDLLRRIFKDQVTQISELMGSSSKGGGGHMNISSQLAYTEFVAQMQLYSVAPPDDLEVEFKERSDKAAGKPPPKSGGGHLDGLTITVDWLLEIARKILVTFEVEKKEELAAVFRSSEARHKAEDGSFTMQFTDFSTMVHAIDTKGIDGAEALLNFIHTSSSANGSRTFTITNAPGGKDGVERSHHELVLMYEQATGQHHDEHDGHEVDEQSEAGGVMTFARFQQVAFQFTVGVGLHFTDRYSSVKEELVHKFGLDHGTFGEGAGKVSTVPTESE